MTRPCRDAVRPASCDSSAIRNYVPQHARERFNRESARRGIGDNPRIKKGAALPTAREAAAAPSEDGRKSKKPEASFRLF
ncbi:hypothetical protein CBM2585_A80208 [Cupriavidus taiwanensis]|nr:hypothetical protein CBM2585_A80208 [Cupriavidus taiwanensis]